jgi:hypothetical protein
MTNLFFLLFFILICFVCFLNLGSYVPHYCSVWCRWFHSIWKIYTRTTSIFNRNCSVPPITHVYVRIPLLLYRQSADVFFTWASFALNRCMPWRKLAFLHIAAVDNSDAFLNPKCSMGSFLLEGVSHLWVMRRVTDSGIIKKNRFPD